MGAFLKMPLALLKRYYRKLWLRVLCYALLSLLVAAIEPVLERWIDLDFAPDVAPEGVMTVLTILASSMLAVSTFSLNVMVSAHRAAAASATPRIHRLLLDDTTTHTVLAVFIGAFVYALTTIILIQAGLYADTSAFITMAVTVLVVVMVIAAMLRWIDHLSHLGSMDHNMRNVFDLTRDGLTRFARRPALGAALLREDTVLPEQLTPLTAPASGYLQLIDVDGLNTCLQDISEGSFLYVSLFPGQTVLRGQPLSQLSGSASEAELSQLARHFVIGDIRTYEQDPDFGLTVLSEMSSRALSPGVNDPGTAIEAVTRLEMLLWDYGHATGDPDTATAPRVFVKAPTPAHILQSAFAATARDGAGQIEVARHLREALSRLASLPDASLAAAARDLDELVLAYCDKALPLEAERQSLRRAF
ncbi:DUF2254 domain-containing protein [Roseovarius sp.]|uniref:DUF2254 domain-containing protein n=1 Tax=Roseovarius sp. TaxID=1486281 RepID=UPI000C386F17|nr:DUF2254 domain-containing protein [Roseovarius sp.]MAO27966.1 hypothetical protein [Roseovarius sp.]MAZ19934.1 hypothetical protein [Roseovarius sp.]|tara:strand:+ start:548 stop:1801 length:1254 start_codon:yes stop_codon:yes gene_type:complete